MEITVDTRERIFAAANALYEQAGRAGNFPTVDAVRKLCKVNMNDASVGMREWRRVQSAQAAPAAVQVPEAIHQAGSIALAALWREAQGLSNESLRAAQAGWDAERIEAETLSRQMADAYEALAVELEAAQVSLSQLRSDAERESAANLDLQRRLDAAAMALAAATAATETANARTVEIERRAAELRVELDHAHEETTLARDELAALRQAHAGECEALRTMSASDVRRLATQLEAVTAGRDQEAIAAAKAREEFAALRGKMEAIEDQNSRLLQTLKVKPEARGSNGKKE